jgi:DNA modification methylase
MQSGMDLRIGDCRLVLGDIADESVPLILTDPPYGNEAAPLYEWLARFAARVLIPGGSLICYTGTTLLPRDHRILGAHLTYWWQAVMLHDSSQRVFGAGVIAQQKPILWYVKGQRRGRALVADVIRSRRDRLKLEHEWSQGGGGVDHWIHQLTEPEETVVDPFAGTATWGRIACELGRRWIGADIVAGGTTHIKADDLNGEEKDGA